MFNREIVLPKATEVTNMVIAHCNNIRSKISGAAIDALKDLFRFLKKALIQNLEFGVKSLMAEAGKENMFLREKCEKCFVEIIDAMISTRYVLFFFPVGNYSSFFLCWLCAKADLLLLTDILFGPERLLKIRTLLLAYLSTWCEKVKVK